MQSRKKSKEELRYRDDTPTEKMGRNDNKKGTREARVDQVSMGSKSFNNLY